MLYKKKSTGFTLIELLVVISIIAILTAVVLANLQKARSKSRDTKRIADISQLQLALALYLNAQGSYPTGTGISSLTAPLSTTGHFIAQIPTDPGNDPSLPYGYVSSDGTSYCLSAVLENPSSYVNSTVTCDTDVTSIPTGDFLYKVTK